MKYVMKKIKLYRDPLAWRLVDRMSLIVYLIAANHIKKLLFGLISPGRRWAISDSIVEGDSGRERPLNCLNHPRMTRDFLYEELMRFIIPINLGLMDHDALEKLLMKSEMRAGMLYPLLRRLSKT